MSQEQDELIAEAELGEDARKFLESDLGKCLIGMAEQDALIAQQALATVDPHNWIKIVELQNKAQLAAYFKQYLAELVHRGNNALQVFVQQRGN